MKRKNQKTFWGRSVGGEGGQKRLWWGQAKYKHSSLHIDMKTL